MPSISTITAFDNESTPVEHSFIPERVNNGIAYYSERSAASNLGRWPISVSVRPPNSAAQRDAYTRIRLTFAMPVTVDETVNGVTRATLERTYRADVEVKVPVSGSEQERLNFVEVLANVLDDPHVREILETPEAVYG